MRKKGRCGTIDRGSTVAPATAAQQGHSWCSRPRRSAVCSATNCWASCRRCWNGSSATDCWASCRSGRRDHRNEPVGPRATRWDATSRMVSGTSQGCTERRLALTSRAARVWPRPVRTGQRRHKRARARFDERKALWCCIFDQDVRERKGSDEQQALQCVVWTHWHGLPWPTQRLVLWSNTLLQYLPNTQQQQQWTSMWQGWCPVRTRCLFTRTWVNPRNSASIRRSRVSKANFVVRPKLLDWTKRLQFSMEATLWSHRPSVAWELGPPCQNLLVCDCQTTVVSHTSRLSRSCWNHSGIQLILKREMTRAGNCWYKNWVAAWWDWLLEAEVNQNRHLILTKEEIVCWYSC